MKFLLFFLESVRDKRQELYNRIINDHFKGVTLNDFNKEKITNLVNQIVDADVTTRFGNTDYVDQVYSWINKKSIQFPEDFQKTKELIRDYHKLKQHLPALKTTTINQFNSFGDLFKTVQDAKGRTSKINKQESFELVDTNGEYKLYLIKEKDKEAFCKLTKSTGWCVKDPEYFDHYKPPYYLVTKGNQLYALLHKESLQAKNVSDSPLTKEEALPIIKWIEKLFPYTIVRYGSSDGDVYELLSLYTDKTVNYNLLKDLPEHSYNYARELNFQNVPPEIVKAITQDAGGSYYYAQGLNFQNVPPEIVKGIAQVAYYSYEYAKYLDFQNVPPEIVKGIAQDAGHSYYYARKLNFLNVPPEIVKAITQDAEGSYVYAEGLNFGRNGTPVPKQIMDSALKSQYTHKIPSDYKVTEK